MLIKTCHAIDTYYDYNKIFRPVDHIEARIKQLTSLFSSNTIGIHVRRTDHTIAIKESSDDYFFHLMDSELASNPQTNFYLATDDDTVKRKMEEKYGNKIITIHNAPLCRSSVKGMQHARGRFILPEPNTEAYRFLRFLIFRDCCRNRKNKINDCRPIPREPTK